MADEIEDLWMVNPDLPSNPAVPVTRLAYSEVWKHRGWMLTDRPAEHSELAEPAAPSEAPAGKSAKTPAAQADDAEAEPSKDTPAKDAGSKGRK